MDRLQRIQRIQRWIGAPVSGDLNDPGTIDELEKDIVGIKEYLASQDEIQTVHLSGGGFRDVSHFTPNMGGALNPIGIVWHHSTGTLAGDTEWLTKGSAAAGNPVSYHIIIAPDGTRHHFVPLNKVAWHAGESSFNGRYGCNQFMAGVAFTGSTYERVLNDAELSSALELVKRESRLHGWTLDTMTDHRQVSPGRKDDLNPVEWQRLKLTLKSGL